MLLKASAQRANGVGQDISYSVEFNGSSQVPIPNQIPTSDPTDKIGPAVVATAPTDNGYVGSAGQITVTFNKPIDRAVEQNPSAITIGGPTGSSPTVPVADLSQDQLTLTLHCVGLQPGNPYTLTVSPQSVKDLNGNAFDQIPSTPQPDSFSMVFRSAPEISTALPGMINGRGVAINGNRLYALDFIPATATSPEGNYLRAYDISNPSAPVPLGSLSLIGQARDLVVIPNYPYALPHNGITAQTVQTNELVAVVGGDLGSTISGGGPGQFNAGDILVPGQYLWVVNMANPQSPVVLASPIVTFRDASVVPKVIWAPPYLAYQEFGPDFHQIGFVNLQEMMWGFNAPLNVINNFPDNGRPGTDFIGDGEYVDSPSDVLPLPPRRPNQFFGFDFSYLIEGTSQKILDYAVLNGGQYVGVTLSGGYLFNQFGVATGDYQNPSYRTLAVGGQAVNPTNASVPFITTAYPGNVSILQLPITVNGVPETPVLALVSVSGDTGRHFTHVGH